MKFRSIYITLILLLSFQASAQIRVFSKIGAPKNTIRIGEQTKFIIGYEHSEKVDVIWPEIDTLNSKIEILSTSEIRTTKGPQAKEVLTQSKELTIISFDTGQHVIPSIGFVSNSDTFRTNELTLYVKGIEVDTTKQFMDIKEIQDEKYELAEQLEDNWMWIAIGAGILLTLIILIILLKRKKKPMVIQPEKVLSLHEQILLQLKTLQEKNLLQRHLIKPYYSELTDILRTYIEKRYRVNAHEQTTAQLMANLRTSEIQTDARLILQNILQLADMVKFAKASPDQYENEGAMNKAVEFVALTREQEKTEPKAKNA